MTALTLNENESLPMDEEYTNAQEGIFWSRTADTEEIQEAQRVTLELLAQQQAGTSAHLGHLPSSSVTLPPAHLFYTTPTAPLRGNENEPFTQSPRPGAQVQMSLVDLVNYTRYAKRKADASNTNEELSRPTAEERSTRHRLALDNIMTAINLAEEDFDFSF